MIAWLLFVLLQAPGEAPLTFRDVAEEAGLLPAVGGIRGHAAGWGDVDGDGRPDLYVGTFHTEGSKANLFFRNRKGGFQADPQPALHISTRANSALFVDLDNDGDLDLYVASMPTEGISPCSLFRNDGGGRFVDVSAGNGACPPSGFAGRSATALDADGDGLLDLLVADCVFPSYQGKRSSRLFRNRGDLKFEDVSEASGIPAGVPGLGVAVADVNLDGAPDLFIAGRDAGNRLFLNDGKGRFREASCSPKTFESGKLGGDDSPAGVVIGDVDRDGLPDLLIGQHYKTPWRQPVPLRLFRNRGIDAEGNPSFEEITAAAGLLPLPMKAPHVEIQDFDNDGWVDLSTSVVKFSRGRPHPVIFRGLGVRDGLPRFRDDAMGVNDFPSAEDRAIGRSGDFFKKMLEDGKIFYGAPGPSADFDGDGKLDLFIASWWLERPSLLLKNETAGGHWLQLRLVGRDGVNRMGLGSKIRIYKAGQAGQASALLGFREMSVGFGYTSGQPAIAHFGLGSEERCDVEVEWPHGRGKLLRSGVAADQLLVVER